MKNKILVIGENSFLAKSFIENTIGNDIFSLVACSHNNIPENLGQFNWVVNFSINPSYYAEKYSEEIDQDAYIAKLIAKTANTKFCFISTRVVYDTNNSAKPISENSSEIKTSLRTYGLNKLHTEKNIINLLGIDRVLIPRASNIFGLEYGRHTFMGIAQKKLMEENKIVLDISRNTIRDFININDFSQALFLLISNNKKGIYNLGVGEAITLNEICSALIEGYGSGNLIDTEAVKDQFVLDTTKLHNSISIKIDKNSILNHAKNIGSELKGLSNGN